VITILLDNGSSVKATPVVVEKLLDASLALLENTGPSAGTKLDIDYCYILT
jgi:hypothetical protein